MKKSTLLVVLLAAALGGGVWYFEFKREKPPEETTAAAKPLFSFKQEDISALTVTRSGETLSLEKRGDAWRLTQPLDSATDANTVDTLLSSLSYGRINRSIPIQPPGSAEALKTYGLDGPGVTLEIKLKTKAAHRLRLGAKDFTGGNVYALVDDGKDVALVPEDIFGNASKPALEFRDRRIAVFNEENLTRLRVKNEHETFVAAKNSEGKWIVAEPAALKGKEAETERIVNALRETRADDILDSPKPAERARLAHPAIEVELTSKDGPARKVEFSGGKGDVYARSSIGPMLFKVSRTILDTLNFKPADLVKKEEPKAEDKPKKILPPRNNRKKAGPELKKEIRLQRSSFGFRFWDFMQGQTLPKPREVRPYEGYAAWVTSTAGVLEVTVGFCQMARSTTWPFTGEMWIQ